MPIPLGILAVAGAGGGAAGFDLLETTLISSDTASVTFSNLSNYSAYKHLQIRMTHQVTTSGSGSNEYILMRFNGDSASNYAHHRLGVEGGSPTSNQIVSTTAIYCGYAVAIFGTQNNNMYGASIIDILDFGSTARNKTVRSFGGADGNSDDDLALFTGHWRNTNAITSISLIPNNLSLRTGTRVSLYGMGG